MSSPEHIDRALDRAVDEGVFPGAVLLVEAGGRLVYQRAAGGLTRSASSPRASLATIYDLASLTKPLATAGALLCLAQDGKVALDRPVRTILGELGDRPVGAATLRQLLGHCGGLAAWLPFYEYAEARDRTEPGFLGSESARLASVAYVGREPLAHPIGTRSLYSDPGFMLLGRAVETVAGCSLRDYCRARLFTDMEARWLDFREVPGGGGGRAAPREEPDRIAPTEEDPWRGRLLCGEVHDENAYAMGGIAGHAGLFGDAGGVLAAARHWLAGVLGRGSLLDRDLAREFTTARKEVEGSTWALGWDTPSVPSSSGQRFSPRSFGHLGFTGTSLWVDPACELVVVLLSNRVHPSRRNLAIQQFRPAIHDLVYETFIGK